MAKTYLERLAICDTIHAAGKGLTAITYPEADLVHVKVSDWILPAPPSVGTQHTWTAYAGDDVLSAFGIS